MIGTLVLMCGGLIMNKLRILDGLRRGDFNLVGILVWREIQITDGTSQKFLQCHYLTCSGWKWWQSCQSDALNNARSHDKRKWLQQGIQEVVVILTYDISVIWISRQTGMPTRLKSPFQKLYKILKLLIMRLPHIKTKVPIMFLTEFCIGWAI